MFRDDGAVETRTSCAEMPGTTVTADNLFCRLPVRRNYYKSANRRKEELDKVKMLVQAFAIVCSDLKFSLQHNKGCVWSSPGGGQHMLDSVALVIGRRESNGLEKFIEYLDPVTVTGDLLEKETEFYLRTEEDWLTWRQTITALVTPPSVAGVRAEYPMFVVSEG